MKRKKTTHRFDARKTVIMNIYSRKPFVDWLNKLWKPWSSSQHSLYSRSRDENHFFLFLCREFTLHPVIGHPGENSGNNFPLLGVCSHDFFSSLVTIRNIRWNHITTIDNFYQVNQYWSLLNNIQKKKSSVRIKTKCWLEILRWIDWLQCPLKQNEFFLSLPPLRRKW